jgi:hypothetical protein
MNEKLENIREGKWMPFCIDDFMSKKLDEYEA